jgi:DHA1 family bicyclomycin/chloramphenicol resistance-like MFS transporter
VLRAASAVNLAFGAVLLGLVASGAAHGLAAIVLPLFGFVASLGFIFPNGAALALAPQGARAGSAAALLGAIQFGLATLVSALVSATHDGTALPMAGAVALCAGASFLALRVLGPRAA